MGVLAYKKRETYPVHLSVLKKEYPQALVYIKRHINLKHNSLNILATSTKFNVEALPVKYPSNLVNLKIINDIRYINKFFETVNARLIFNGFFIGCFESQEQRKKRIFKKYPGFIASLFFGIDFIWKRVIPKLWIAKTIYFGLTKGNNRVLSIPEVLGRLISCGFNIIDYQEVNAITFFCVRKFSTPVFDSKPTYGPLITLKRIGLNGKLIRIYKFRTMHPYSEYLQNYIYLNNNLQGGGKIKNDFRITKWGKVLRKFWLDELPMIYNWLKGDVKVVGVRPLSQQYFELYPEDFRHRRIQYKPGLLPPFYVDLPSTFEEIIESEKKYLDAYDEKPYVTDLKYAYSVFYNIFIKRARSN